ncbi:MAG: glycosyltransferase family 9 protein [Verrucomicrobia bacterium]|nr:glycosyltransferase family 9 protein [Verrucomicrobiota bacterium]
MGATHAQGGFLQKTRGARKVMVLDLGFLGDTVHLLPALWMVRQAYPHAELHAAVSDHVISLMACFPWVDRAWGYPRFPKHATLRQNLQMVARMRKERFDVLINLNGSDRSSWLTFLSGASARLGRRPKDGGPPFWGRMFTDFVQYYSATEPVYLQKCRCLEQAGFPFKQAEFHAQIDRAHLQAAGITEADARTYFHLSPFTTADKKELSPEQLVELITALESRFPQERWVLSGAPNDRERRKMAALVAKLPRKPWRVFAGDLNLVQLAAVIQHSAVHLCGDTGTLHLALMTGASSVSWYRPGPGIRTWAPVGDRHHTVVGTTDTDEGALRGIETSALVCAVEEVLGSAGSASR